MSRGLLPGFSELSAADTVAGWRRVQIGDVAQVVGGGKLRLTKENDYVPSGFPAYSAAGQDGFVGTWEYDRNAVIVPSIGSIGRAYRAQGKWTTLANTQIVFPNEQQLHTGFLTHRLDNTSFWPVSGTAHHFIKPSDMPKCWLLLPPIDEQRRIASVLDAVDNSILETERTLAKLRALKLGLLEDLLTGRVRVPDTGADVP
jgi:type I restriction enzyme S subunit